jgi:cytochrome b
MSSTKEVGMRRIQHVVCTAAAMAKPATRRTVDAPTRMFHWLLALSFIGAYLTADGERFRLLHVTLGYTVAGLLAFRVLWGLMGPRHARLSGLWRKLQGLPLWLRSLKDGTPNWRLAQNLLLALGVAVLLALIVPLTLSGYGTYSEWTGEWLEEVHEFLGNAMLVVVLGHVGLILILSLLRGRNQAKPMVTGRADGVGPDLVRRNHGALAWLLLAAVLAFWTWQWRESPGGLLAAGEVRSQPVPGGQRVEHRGKWRHHDDD